MASCLTIGDASRRNRFHLPGGGPGVVHWLPSTGFASSACPQHLASVCIPVCSLLRPIEFLLQLTNRFSLSSNWNMKLTETSPTPSTDSEAAPIALAHCLAKKLNSFITNTL